MSTAGAAYSFASNGVPVASAYPLHYAVPEPVRPLSRVRTLLRAVLLIPAAIALGVVGWLAGLITIAAWFVILFSGRYDRSLWSLPAGYVERLARQLTSASLLRDELPPLFGGEYPVEFALEHPAASSRGKAFFRGVLLIPLWVVLYFWGAVWVACVVIAWFAILFTARYPEGIRRLVVGLNRWYLRVAAYALLLRDEYPPFSLGLEEPVTIPTAANAAPLQHVTPAHVMAPWPPAGEQAPVQQPAWYEETRAAPPLRFADPTDDTPTMLYPPSRRAAEPAGEQQAGGEQSQEPSSSPQFYVRPQRAEDGPDAG